MDYARLVTELEAARAAAILRLEATPAAQMTGKERSELRRLFSYEQQVKHGLRTGCAQRR